MAIALFKASIDMVEPTIRKVAEINDISMPEFTTYKHPIYGDKVMIAIIDNKDGSYFTWKHIIDFRVIRYYCDYVAEIVAAIRWLTGEEIMECKLRVEHLPGKREPSKGETK